MTELEATINFWQTLLDTSAWTMPPSVVTFINKTLAFLIILRDHYAGSWQAPKPK